MKKSTLIIIIIAILAALTTLAVWLLWPKQGNDNENTPIQILTILPRQDLYVATAIVEDYTTRKATGTRFFILETEHTCIQMLRQKVSYRINLSDVVITKQGGDTINVSLPDLEYTASTLSTRFYSDDEAFWHGHMPNTNQLKQEVAERLKQRFDTPENRNRAVASAQRSIGQMLRQMGYEPVFHVSHITTPPVEHTF